MRKNIGKILVLIILLAMIPMKNYTVQAAENKESTKEVKQVDSKEKIKLDPKEKKFDSKIKSSQNKSEFLTIGIGDYVGTLNDGCGTNQSVFLSEVNKDYYDDVIIKLNVISDYAYLKDDNYRLEVFLDSVGNSQVEYYGAVDYYTSGYKNMSFTMYADSSLFSDQEYIYMRFGTYTTYGYYNSVLSFKVKNPYYQGKWEVFNGKWYFKEASGNYAKGWKVIGGYDYYFDSTGKMVTNDWIKSNNNWYYMSSSGVMSCWGWEAINGKYYYFNYDGKMQTGWIDEYDGYYYCDSTGAMLTGWQFINGSWYHLASSGLMDKEWININGTYYYLGDNGKMITGWKKINYKWYYMNGSGAMLTGWQFMNGSWYYLEASGAMLTGWQFINGEWYYLYNDGAMATNVVIDGWTIGFDGIAKK